MGKFKGLVWHIAGSLAVAIMISAVVNSAGAAQLFFFDFDGTIFLPRKTDKNTPGIYDTKIKLYKIRKRPNLLVQMPDGPDMIEVSTSDFKYKLTKINETTEKKESLLSPGDGRIGSLEKVTLSNGITIVPGLYRLVNPESFEYYRESSNGRNYLLEDFKLAEQLEAKKIGTFRGPFWNQMVNLLSSETTAKQFGIITARGHSAQEWKEFFDYLLARGYIKHLPDINHIHNIGRSEYEKYGMNGQESIRKIELLKDIALNLSQKKYVSTDSQIHSLFFVDDNQQTLKLAYQEFRRLATKRMNVKFILSNSGLDHEVKKSKKPRSFVVTSDGIARPATDAEIYGEYSHAGLLGKSCAMIFN